MNVDIKCITLHLKPLRRAFLGFPRESHREQEADEEGGEKEEEVEEVEGGFYCTCVDKFETLVSDMGMLLTCGGYICSIRWLAG